MVWPVGSKELAPGGGGGSFQFIPVLQMPPRGSQASFSNALRHPLREQGAGPALASTSSISSSRTKRPAWRPICNCSVEAHVLHAHALGLECFRHDVTTRSREDFGFIGCSDESLAVPSDAVWAVRADGPAVGSAPPTDAGASLSVVMFGQTGSGSPVGAATAQTSGSAPAAATASGTDE